MHTPTTLAQLITERMEPEHAERVLAALKALQGQLITTRLLDKLPGGRVEWRMSREYGWTTIKNRAYATSKGDSPDGLDLMLARSEASVPLDAAWVEQENARYFAGRRERNAQRAQAMANKAVLAQLADVMNEIEQLKRQLACATEQFNTFTEPSDAPCHVERYALQRACGLREEAR